MRALVSATDVTAVLKTHVDRVNDAARRLGCTSQEASEVTAAAALELIEALAQTPEIVGDLVGGLYSGARRVAGRVHQGRASPPAADPLSVGAALVPDVEQDAAVSAALSQLPEERRYAVLLRDSYGLDVAQAAVGIGRDRAETARAVALGRLAVAVAVDGRPLPDMSGHDVALGDLGELSDGTASAAGRYAAVRRHVSSCPICANVLDLQTRGRALIGGLPILGLPDDVRTQLLAATGDQATALLPSAAQILAELDGEVATPRLISPLRVGLALTLAALLGIGLGALLAPRGTGSATSAALLGEPALSGTPVTPLASPTKSLGPTPSQFSPRPVAVLTTSSPTKSPTPTQTPSPATRPSASTTPSANVSSTPPTSTPPTSAPDKAAITLSPPVGTAGAPVTVTGTGFTPGATVTVTYSQDPGSVMTPVSATGTFTVQFTPGASDLPGLHEVVATDGKESATADFAQET